MPFIERKNLVMPWDILAVSREVTVFTFLFYLIFLSEYPRISTTEMARSSPEERISVFYITTQYDRLHFLCFLSLRRNASTVESRNQFETHAFELKCWSVFFSFQLSTGDNRYATFWIFAKSIKSAMSMEHHSWLKWLSIMRTNSKCWKIPCKYLVCRWSSKYRFVWHLKYGYCTHNFMIHAQRPGAFIHIYRYAKLSKQKLGNSIRTIIWIDSFLSLFTFGANRSTCSIRNS